MAQTVNPATSVASADADLAASSKAWPQATIVAFGDVLAQEATAGASPNSVQKGSDSAQAATASSQAATKNCNPLSGLVQRTDEAVGQAVAAQSTLDSLQAAAASGDSSAQAELDIGSAQTALANAEGKLNQAINNEISATASPNNDASAVIAAGESIAARYANDPESAVLVTSSVLEVLIGRLGILVDKSGLVLSKSLIESALAQVIGDFEKFSKNSPNHVRPRAWPGEGWAASLSDNQKSRQVLVSKTS